MTEIKISTFSERMNKMKNEYYTLHSNGSFEKLNKSDLFQNGKEKRKNGVKLLMRRKFFIPVFNLSLLILVGLSLTLIFSLHINGNINYQISHLIQVKKKINLLEFYL